MLIYLAGPYSGKNYSEISDNIDTARQIAIKLWEKGHAVITPHLNTAHFEVDCDCDYEDYMRGDLMIIARCDAMVMLPGWKESKGAVRERQYALDLGMPVYEGPSDGQGGIFIMIPELHPTEVNSPIQCKAFAENLGIMYRLHLSKNADYSPANIAGPGELGLATRLWDKVTRLMNLIGFKVYTRTNDVPKTFWQKFWYLVQGRVVIIDEIIYTEPRVPKHESIEDTLNDNSVYSLIFKLFREGKWGR